MIDALERRCRQIDPQEIVHLCNFCRSRGNRRGQRRIGLLEVAPLCGRKLIEEIDYVLYRRGIRERRLYLRCQFRQCTHKIALLHQRRSDALKNFIDRRHISGNFINNLIQAEQNRHLNQQEEAAAAHARPVLLINRSRLCLHACHRRLICLSLILLLYRLKFRLHDAHQLGRLLLRHGERPHQQVRDNGK